MARTAAQFCLHERLKPCGFTLVELLLVLLLIAITAVWALPSLGTTLQNSRLRAGVHHLVGGLHYARAEALSRGEWVSVCPSRTALSCDSGNQWHPSFMAYLDRNQNRRFDDGDLKLRFFHVPKLVALWGSEGRDHVTFNAQGETVFGNTTFRLCDPRGSVAAQAVILSAPGKIRVSDRLANNLPIPCTP